MRRLAVLLLAALAVLPPPAPRAAQDPRGEMQAVLDARAAALRDGDLRGFLSSVDRSDPAFVRRQRLLFRGFRRVGITDYSLRATDRYWPELTTWSGLERYGAAASPTILHVEERYAIDGYDEQLALEDLFLTFVRRGRRWLVASDADLDDLTLFSGRKLWEFGPVVTRESQHFLYVSHPDRAEAAGEILAASERALGTVRALWPLPWSERVVILAPSTTDELRRMLQATFDLDVFVAFASSSVDRDRDWDLTGHRIILNPPNFERYGAEVRERILTHELLHVATREYSGPHVPAFVDEGIAEVVSSDTSTSVLGGRVGRDVFDARLPEDFEFVSGADDDILNSYEESYTAMRFAADTYGRRAVAELYRLVGEIRLAPGTWRYHVDRAMRAAFGIPYREFERRWATHIRETLG